MCSNIILMLSQCIYSLWQFPMPILLICVSNHLADIFLILGQSRRWLSNNKTTLAECLVYVRVEVLSQQTTQHPVYHFYNVGPTSSTLVQHRTNVMQMFNVWWDSTMQSQNAVSAKTFVNAAWNYNYNITQYFNLLSLPSHCIKDYTSRAILSRRGPKSH